MVAEISLVLGLMVFLSGCGGGCLLFKKQRVYLLCLWDTHETANKITLFHWRVGMGWEGELNRPVIRSSLITDALHVVSPFRSTLTARQEKTSAGIFKNPLKHVSKRLKELCICTWRETPTPDSWSRKCTRNFWRLCSPAAIPDGCSEVKIEDGILKD